MLGAGGAGGDHGPAAARAGAGDEPVPAETLPRSGADTGMLGPAIAALALAAGIAAIRRRLG